MLFLPRNTSIEELITRLLPFHDRLTDSSPEKPKTNELVLEVEELMYGNYSKGLLVSTGKLAKVYANDVSNLFVSRFCYEMSSA
jgi:hypothetical protein